MEAATQHPKPLLDAVAVNLVLEPWMEWFEELQPDTYEDMIMAVSAKLPSCQDYI